MTRTESKQLSRGSRRCFDPRTAVTLILLKLGVAGCHRQLSYPGREGTDAGFGTAQVTLGFDECPGVVLIISPATARIGEPIAVRAAVVGTDAGIIGPLTYSWTASASVFASPTSADTTYTCPGRDRAGPQLITVTVSDGICSTTKSANVGCYALADGGGPATTPDPDAGRPADADIDSGCTPGDDPTMCEGQGCDECTTANCPTLAGVAIQGGAVIAGCDDFASDDEQARCQRLYACMRDSGCVRNSDPSACWCGGVDTADCEQGLAQANGPCVQQFIDAAGTNIPTLIDERSTDPTYPIGGAINLATCRSVYCSRLSDPPNPVCHL
jgi:hypothetical protein